jgi:hypothetical protein
VNIFFLDYDPVKAAVFQCDKHVVKMTLETAQLLSSVHRVYKTENAEKVYKLTHKNHPCAIWARASVDNYVWLYNHFSALCYEYSGRYFRTHKCESLLPLFWNPPSNLPDIGFTAPAQAMPDEFKHKCPVVAYKRYYLEKSKTIKMVWTYAEIPDFIKGM